MKPNVEILENRRELNCNDIVAATGQKAKVKCSGDSNLILDNNKVRIKDVLYVPDLNARLLSVHKIVSQGNVVTFDKDGCEIYSNKNELVAFCKPDNGVYYKLIAKKKVCMLANSASASAMICYKRLGHLNFNYLKLLRDRHVGVKFSDDDTEI